MTLPFKCVYNIPRFTQGLHTQCVMMSAIYTTRYKVSELGDVLMAGGSYCRELSRSCAEKASITRGGAALFEAHV